MRDNVSIIFAVFFAVVLLIILPLASVLDRQDSIAYNVALKVTTNFVNEVRNKGFIDLDSYKEYMAQLSTTGVIYDVKMEAYRSKAIIADDLDPDNITFKEEGFLDNNIDILKQLEKDPESVEGSTKDSNAYLFEVGDEFYISLYNRSVSSASLIYKFLSGTANTKIIDIKYGGVINKIDWKLYEQLVGVYNLAPAIHMSLPKGVNTSSTSTPIVASYERTYTETSKMNKTLNYEYLFDITDYNSLGISPVRYAYGESNQHKDGISFYIKFEKDSSLNVSDHATEEEKKEFIKSKIILNGITVKRNEGEDLARLPENIVVTILPDADYYDLEIVLKDILLVEKGVVTAKATLTFADGLLKAEKEGTEYLSNQTDSVEFIVYDQLGSSQVSISGPYIYNYYLVSGNDKIMTELIDGKAYKNVEFFYVISYSGLNYEPNFADVVSNYFNITDDAGNTVGDKELISSKYSTDYGSGNFIVKASISDPRVTGFYAELLENWAGIASEISGAKVINRCAIELDDSNPSADIKMASTGKLGNEGKHWYNDEKIKINVNKYIYNMVIEAESGVCGYYLSVYDLDKDVSIEERTEFFTENKKNFMIETKKTLPKNGTIRIYVEVFDNTCKLKKEGTEIKIVNPSDYNYAYFITKINIDRKPPISAKHSLSYLYHEGENNIYKAIIDSSSFIDYNGKNEFADKIEVADNTKWKNSILTLDTPNTYIVDIDVNGNSNVRESFMPFWLKYDESYYLYNGNPNVKNKQWIFEITELGNDDGSGYSHIQTKLNNIQIYNANSDIDFQRNLMIGDIVQGENTLVTTTYDYAGNKSELKNVFYVDTIAPTISVSCGNKLCKDAAIPYLTKSDTPLEVELKVEDNTSPLFYVYYKIEDITNGESNAIIISEFTSFDINNKLYNYSYLIKEPGTYKIVVKAMDMAQNEIENTSFIKYNNSLNIVPEIICSDSAYEQDYAKECNSTDWYNYIDGLYLKLKVDYLDFEDNIHQWKKDDSIISNEKDYKETEETASKKYIYNGIFDGIDVENSEYIYNYKVSKDVTIKYDKTPPTAGNYELVVNESNYSGGWTNQNVILEFDAGSDDISGIKETKVIIDEEIIESTTPKVTISGEGIHNLYIKYTDNANNITLQALKTIKIDKSAPTVKIKKINNSNNIVIKDSESGVYEYTIKKDNITMKNEVKISKSEILYKLSNYGTYIVIAKDNVGNEKIYTVIYKEDETYDSRTDITAPTIWYYGDNICIQDKESGLKEYSVQYAGNSNDVEISKNMFYVYYNTTDELGTYKVTAEDNNGNSITKSIVKDNIGLHFANEVKINGNIVTVKNYDSGIVDFKISLLDSVTELKINDIKKIDNKYINEVTFWLANGSYNIDGQYVEINTYDPAPTHTYSISAKKIEGENYVVMNLPPKKQKIIFENKDICSGKDNDKIQVTQIVFEFKMFKYIATRYDENFISTNFQYYH